MIKTIIFDFGGVIGTDANIWKFEEGKNFLEKTGLSIDQINKLWNQHWPQMAIGKESLDVLLSELVTLSNTHISQKDLRRTYFGAIKVYPAMMDLLIQLKTKGYCLLLLSNESKEGMNYKRTQFNLNNYFHKIFCSADIGLRKPDIELFKIVIKQEKLNPIETIFIDDREKNVATAKELGINAIFFQDENQLKQRFVTLGVSVK